MFTSRYHNQFVDLKSVCSEKRALKSNEKSSSALNKVIQSCKSTEASSCKNVNSLENIEVSSFDDTLRQSN